MKKSIVLLLASVMVLSAFLAGCQPKDKDIVIPEPAPGLADPAPTPSGPPAEPVGELKIGDITELTGDWVPYWTNNAADYNIYNFIMGYRLVGMNFDGSYEINKTVVKDYKVDKTEDGSKTYTFTINDNLTYADGSPITALDYVTFGMLWSSPQVTETKGKANAGLYWTGYDDFSKGKSKVFPGVRLLGDYEFSFTIDAANLPYFYELANVDAFPTKLSYWTDETVEIKDDGKGCYFSDHFTAEAYKERFEKARFGVKDFPANGAYKLVSYDESQRIAVIEVNDKYLGDHNGQKPKIETIIYKKVTSATALDELKTGGVDILQGMASGKEISAGHDLADEGGFSFVDYPRAGYGRIAFQCDFGPTQYVEVRQAIAHLLDRNKFAQAFTSGFGTIVHGPYGEALWFYQETKGELNKKINTYAYSLEDARGLLEDGGWIYDKDGKEYKEGLRYKKGEDGKLIPLVIEWAASENNPVSELLVVQLQNNPDVAAVGMQINQTIMSLDELFNYLYREGAEDSKYAVPKYGMYNLGIGFDPEYDLNTEYTDDPEMLEAGYNTNFIVDKQLATLAKEMVLADPENKDEFKAKFVDFIVRWNELLPDIPLYSNLYHDFFNNKLKDYERNDIIKISDALLYAYVAE